MRSVIRNENGWRQLGAKLIWDGKPYEVVVRPFKRKRTLSQNAKMHAMMRELAQHIGYSDGELKDYIKSEHGPKKTITIGDEHSTVPVSTKDYNVSECGDIIEVLFRLGAECGCSYSETNNAGGSR
jgi:hypothetical protein